MAKTSKVKITIYDALGREVKTPVNAKMDAGNYNVDWNTTYYSAGIYFYTIKADEFVSTKKMVLLK